MVDNLKDISDSERQNYPWPDRYVERAGRTEFVENALEGSLRINIDWGAIAGLKATYSYPHEVLKASPEELYDKAGVPLDKAESVKEIIMSWSSDPKSFEDSYIPAEEPTLQRIKNEPPDKIEIEEL